MKKVLLAYDYSQGKRALTEEMFYAAMQVTLKHPEIVGLADRNMAKIIRVYQSPEETIRMIEGKHVLSERGDVPVLEVLSKRILFIGIVENSRVRQIQADI